MAQATSRPARAPARAAQPRKPVSASADPAAEPAAPHAAPAHTAAARFVWGSLKGVRPTADELDLVRAGLGGVVLFTRNVEDVAAVTALIRQLRAAAAGHLHVGVDQEGGHVVRIREPLTRFPSPMAIAATRSTRLAFEVARATARELAAIGFDVVFAPDLDLAAAPFNPTLGARTFGADPELVARMAAASVRGYLAGGILPMPKHFPGHGRTPLDSHLALPIVPGDRADLAAFDLPPYEQAIAAGAPALMAAHVVYEAFGDGLPATLSAAILRDLVRSELGFEGVLVTDALVMDAFAAGRSIPEAGVDSLIAGSDVLMVLDPAAKVLAAVERATADGRLSEKELAPATVRLDRYATLARRNLARARPIVPRIRAGHREVAEAVARRSLTLVCDDGLLPLRPGTKALLVDVATSAASPVEDPAVVDAAAAPGWPLGASMRRRFPRLAAVRVGRDDLVAKARAVEMARTADVVILATRDAYADPEEQLLVEALLGLDPPVIRLALHSPVDLAVGPPAETLIAAYADVPATCEAIADALLIGRKAFPGRLPMPLPTSALAIPKDEVAA